MFDDLVVLYPEDVRVDHFGGGAVIRRASLQHDQIIFGDHAQELDLLLGVVENSQLGHEVAHTLLAIGHLGIVLDVFFGPVDVQSAEIVVAEEGLVRHNYSCRVPFGDRIGTTTHGDPEGGSFITCLAKRPTRSAPALVDSKTRSGRPELILSRIASRMCQRGWYGVHGVHV